MHRIYILSAMFLAAGCSSLPEGSCKKDTQCSGAQVCFEGKCVTMKKLKQLKEKRADDAKPKKCEDKDGDGIKAGAGCEKGTLVDCNDNDPNMAQGKNEVCDSVDNDCDGMVNEGLKGCVQTLFGGATWGNQKDYHLDGPASVLYDPAGFVLVTDNHHLWKVSLEGEVTLLAGSSLSNFKDGKGSDARFSYPLGMTRAPDGTVYVADCKNNCIRKVTMDGTVSTFAGKCSNFTKDMGQFADGPALAARFYCPADIAMGPDGYFVVVDRGNARIRKLAPDGTTSTLAGIGPMEVKEGEGQDGFADGAALEARFNDPQSVLVDSKGIIYIAESFNCRIRKLDLTKGEHGVVSTLAGKSDTLLGVGGYADGVGKNAKFNYPHGMAWDEKGDMIVADTGNGVIRLVSTTGRVKTLFGKVSAKKGQYRDGPIQEARFQAPMDVAPGPNGSLFVVDAEANRIRWIVR